MDIVSWHRAFKVQLDTLDTQSALRLQPEVVDIFFNKAINRIVQEAYEGFEATQKLSDVLSSQTKLVKYPNSALKTNAFDNNLYGFDLPTDYYFHLQSNATIEIDKQQGNVRTVRHTLDTESKVISNPFERSDDTEIAIFFKLSQIQFYLPKDSNLIEFDMVYLKKPVEVSYKLNIDSDLHPALHEQIINLAVIYALETYGSERTPAKVQIKDVT
jgi:hypothetical protein